jgi:hypothetical protein
MVCACTALPEPNEEMAAQAAKMTASGFQPRPRSM